MKKGFVIVMMLSLFLLASEKDSFAQTKPIELKLSHFMSPMHNIHTDVLVPFAKDLEERTKGRAKITIFPGEALGKARDHYDLAMQGVADIAFFIQGYTAGRFPLTTVIELPIGIPTGKVGSRIIWELYEKHLKAEYPGVKLLTLLSSGVGQIHMAKKPIRTLEDIKGLRIRSPGPQQTALLRELGASPLTIPMPDVYDALNKGMAEGALAPFSPLVDYKLSEVTKFHTIANLYVMPMGLAMNPKVWAGIPPDIQKIIEELCGSRMAEIAGISYDSYDLKGIDAAKKVKSEIISLSPEERKKWSARMSALDDKWIADMEAKGLPGKKVFEEARSLVEKYSK